MQLFANSHLVHMTSYNLDIDRIYSLVSGLKKTHINTLI